MRASFLFSALLTGALAASCASAPPDTSDQSAAPEDAVVLQVDNNSLADVDVYAVSNVGRGRLGRVASLESATLVVSRDLWSAGWFRVETIPRGGPGRVFATSAIHVQGGQQVRLTLEDDPSLSTWRVDPGS